MTSYDRTSAVVILSLCLCPLIVARFIDTDDDQFEPEAHHIEVPVERGETIAAPSLNVSETVQIRSGDSLASLFRRRDISPGDLNRLINSKPFGPRLQSIFPGHQLVITTDQENRLTELSYSPSPWERLEFYRTGDRFEGVEVVTEPERVVRYHQGTIEHSLFAASQRAGLADTVTMRLAGIFQWDIDFVLDIRTGDAFHILLEELYLRDQFIGYGDIRAAEFVNQGDRYRAVLYADSSGEANYYSPDGTSMRKAFLRAPVSFTRISSNFNLRRRHPLWNRTMPHRGIDYAAPTGTPVMAAGSGRVVTVGRTGPNGNYIVIKHSEYFVTKYLHLSRFARNLHTDTDVRQGQTIGYVGSTGWATGSHLHYEFLVNGVHQNPRTVKLPNASPVPKSEMSRFNQATVPLFALLDSHNSNHLQGAQR